MFPSQQLLMFGFDIIKMVALKLSKIPGRQQSSMSRQNRL